MRARIRPAQAHIRTRRRRGAGPPLRPAARGVHRGPRRPQQAAPRRRPARPGGRDQGPAQAARLGLGRQPARAREHPDEVAALVQAGEQLAAAQAEALSSGGARPLRGSQRRARGRARQDRPPDRTAARGSRSAGRLRRRPSGRCARSEPPRWTTRLVADLLAGRLQDDVEPGGFSLLAGLELPARPRGGKAPKDTGREELIAAPAGAESGSAERTRAAQGRRRGGAHRQAGARAGRSRRRDGRGGRSSRPAGRRGRRGAGGRDRPLDRSQALNRDTLRADGEEVRPALGSRRRRDRDLLDRSRRGRAHVPRLRHRRSRRALDLRGDGAPAARRRRAFVGGARRVRERAGGPGAPGRDGRGRRPLGRRRRADGPAAHRGLDALGRRSRPRQDRPGVRPAHRGAADRAGADDRRPLPPPPPGARARRTRSVALVRGELPRDAARRAAGRADARGPSTSR